MTFRWSDDRDYAVTFSAPERSFAPRALEALSEALEAVRRAEIAPSGQVRHSYRGLHLHVHTHCGWLGLSAHVPPHTHTVGAPEPAVRRSVTEAVLARAWAQAAGVARMYGVGEGDPDE